MGVLIAAGVIIPIAITLSQSSATRNSPSTEASASGKLPHDCLKSIDCEKTSVTDRLCCNTARESHPIRLCLTESIFKSSITYSSLNMLDES